MNGDSILLVEDDKEIRQGVEIFLRSQGYQVFQAENGLEGLKILEERPIDLAIVDAGNGRYHHDCETAGKI